jgi:HD-like signal output (HDOD) protein
MMNREAVVEIIRDRKTQLPTLPVVVNNILKAASDDRVSSRDLASFVKRDQAIANKILRLANSAYYGLVSEIATVSRAITVIGFNEVVSLTIGMGVFSTLSKQVTKHGIDVCGLWLHSIACGTACRTLGERKGFEDPARLFLNGLLHDTGKVLMAAYLPKEYDDVLRSASTAGESLHRVEAETLGMDHAVIGGMIMDRWRFPSSLVLPCRYHHDDSRCPPAFQRDADVVAVADFACHKADLGRSGNPRVLRPTPGMKRLGLASDDLKALIQGLREERERIEAFLEATT